MKPEDLDGIMPVSDTNGKLYTSNDLRSRVIIGIDFAANGKDKTVVTCPKCKVMCEIFEGKLPKNDWCDCDT